MKKLTMVLAGAGVAMAGCTSDEERTPPLCVARGTKILTPDGEKLIEEIEVGDEVYCVDVEQGVRMVTTVTFVHKATREVGSVTIGGHTTRMTSDHPVYDPETREYHPAGDWFVQRRTAMLSAQTQLIPVEPDAVSVHDGIAEVFDITVESAHHNFIANGIVVHNKSEVVWCGDNYDGKSCGDAGCMGYFSCATKSCVCKTEPNDVGRDVSDRDTSSDMSSDTPEDSGDSGANDDMAGDLGTD